MTAKLGVVGEYGATTGARRARTITVPEMAIPTFVSRL